MRTLIIGCFLLVAIPVVLLVAFPAYKNKTSTEATPPKGTEGVHLARVTNYQLLEQQSGELKKLIHQEGQCQAKDPDDMKQLIETRTCLQNLWLPSRTLCLTVASNGPSNNPEDQEMIRRLQVFCEEHLELLHNLIQSHVDQISLGTQVTLIELHIALLNMRIEKINNTKH